MLSAANHKTQSPQNSLSVSFSLCLHLVSRIKENHMSIPIWCYSLIDNDDTFFLLLFRLLVFFCLSVCPYHQPTYRTLVFKGFILCSSSYHVSSTPWTFHLFCSFFTYYHFIPLGWCMDALSKFFNNLVILLLTMVHHFGIVKLQGGSPLRICSLKNTYTKPIALMQSAPLVIICEDVYRS